MSLTVSPVLRIFLFFPCGGDWRSPGKKTTLNHCSHWKLDFFFFKGINASQFVGYSWLIYSALPWFILTIFSSFLLFCVKSFLHLHPFSLKVPPTSCILKLSLGTQNCCVFLMNWSCYMPTTFYCSLLPSLYWKNRDTFRYVSMTWDGCNDILVQCPLCCTVYSLVSFLSVPLTAALCHVTIMNATEVLLP